MPPLNWNHLTLGHRWQSPEKWLVNGHCSGSSWFVCRVRRSCSSRHSFIPTGDWRRRLGCSSVLASLSSVRSPSIHFVCLSYSLLWRGHLWRSFKKRFSFWPIALLHLHASSRASSCTNTSILTTRGCNLSFGPGESSTAVKSQISYLAQLLSSGRKRQKAFRRPTMLIPNLTYWWPTEGN